LLIPEATLLLQMESDPNETAALIARARGRVGRTVLNLAPAAAVPVEALRAVDILTVNEPEAAWLGAHLGVGADAVSLRSALGVDVVRTLGEHGLEAATQAGLTRMPARAVTAVDTTAAGDCFVGVLAADLDRGATLTEALARATAAAGLCCTRPGSQASLPWARETNAFL
jgi:ribokinase